MGSNPIWATTEPTRHEVCHNNELDIKLWTQMHTGRSVMTVRRSVKQAVQTNKNAQTLKFSHILSGNECSFKFIHSEA